MTDRERDLDLDLAAWMQAVAPARAPEHLLGATIYRTARTRPRPAWALLGRWPMLTARPSVAGAPPRLRMLAVVLVTLLVLLALVAATLLPLIGSHPQASMPRLGPDVPEGAAQGIVDTPLGPARWVHLSGDMSSLPAGWATAPGDGVFTGEEEQHDENGDTIAHLRWSSSDGMRWTAEPIDDPDGIPYEGGGARWLMTYQPSGLLRSTDGETWAPIDLTSATPEGPASLTWDIEPNGIESTDAATVVHVIARAIEPFETLGWREGAGRMRMVEPGLVEIGVRDEEASPRRLRMTPTDDGLRVTDDADGSIVADLAGTTLADVEGWIGTGPPIADMLTLVEGDRLVPVKPLTYFGDPVGSSLGTMVRTPDGILALILEQTEGPAHRWRTRDGRTWDDLGAWSLPTGEPGGAFYMGEVQGRFHVEYHPPGAGNLDRAWRSDDGVDWDEIWTDVPPDSNLIELTSGTIAQQWAEDGERWLASANGSDWEPIDLSALGVHLGQQQFSFGEAGDTAFIVVDGDGGQRDMWILSFDTVADAAS